MRALFFFPGPIRGGCEEHALLVLRAAAGAGYDVVPCFPFTDGTRSIVEDVAALGLAATPWPMGRWHGRAFLWGDAEAQATAAARILHRSTPDVAALFLPEPDSSVGVLVACARAQVPTVAVFCLVPPDWPVGARDQAWGEWARARQQRWVVNSADNRCALAAAFRIGTPDEITVVRNGTDLPPAWRDPDKSTVDGVRAALRAKLGIPPSARIALTVARLAKPKGHRDLLEAIGALPASCADVHFVWAGAGEEEAGLRAAVRAAGVADRVHLLGYQSNVPALLYAADLFVFPSHWEGFSRALIEAMSAGLPIVASDASSNPEQLGDGRLGLLFPNRDPARLAERISNALAHPDRMRTMAGRARSAGRMMSGQAMCEGTLRVVRELLAGLHPASAGGG